jgi:UDP-N-acetylglucosamine--N-acetylmuramyl-(pentapeptide) pyrophosphoryl-undecaprenol N-acetylglucosamine transferase
MRLVVTGGGTGGHVFAGVAIAQEFKEQSRSNEVLFIGSEQGMENKLVPRAGFRLERLKLGKLVGQGFLSRLITLWQIPWAVLKSFRLLRSFRADLVVGVGGYAAGPCILAARVLGIPVGILEQNSVMGFTNRVAAGLARHVFLAFDEVPHGAPSEKCVFTGNPARSHLKPAPTKPAKPFVVFAFGGSQGATGINRMMTEAACRLLPHKDDVRLIHQTGERDYEWVVKAYEELGYPAEVHRFIDDMQSMYNRASLVVSRAGASTISELAATRNAAVFVPFPLAAANHQEVNARVIERAGGGLVLVQGKSDGSELADVIIALMNDPTRLEGMRGRMAEFHRPDAARRIVETMKAHALGMAQ